jgi:hypothetical protein
MMAFCLSALYATHRILLIALVKCLLTYRTMVRYFEFLSQFYVFHLTRLVIYVYECFITDGGLIILTLNVRLRVISLSLLCYSLTVIWLVSVSSPFQGPRLYLYYTIQLWVCLCVVSNRCWPCQYGHSWVRAQQDSRPCFTLLDLSLLPNWKARSPYLYPLGAGWPNYAALGTEFSFIPFYNTVLWWRHSNPPSHGQPRVNIRTPAFNRWLVILQQACKLFWQVVIQPIWKLAAWSILVSH